ncbi:MAG TPA: hypothetical protein VGO73_06290 [Pyrinomonadaceae bacterium]|nr:hypothetical protein [Pyrinomonadaceae bacterium]
MRVKPKFALALLALFLVGAVTIWLARTRSTRSSSTVPVAEAQASSPEPGSLRWYAQHASAAGDTNFQLILSPRTGRVSDLNEAITNYSMVVGQLVTRESVWYDPPDTIYTWYKFNVTETLTQKPYTPCSSCTFTPTPPADLLPLQAGQILLPLPGGSSMIDDVVVETSIEDFGGMVEGEKYLLFLNLDTNQQGVVPIGPQGILHINYDNTFAPVIMLAQGELEPVSNGLTTQYGNSLVQLRAAFHPPSSCEIHHPLSAVSLRSFPLGFQMAIKKVGRSAVGAQPILVSQKIMNLIGKD